MTTVLTDIYSILQTADSTVFLTVNSLHNNYFDSVMWFISGKMIWIPMYASLLFVLLKNYPYKVVLKILLAMGIIFFFTDCFTSQVIRPWVCRLRPSNLDNPISHMVHIVDGYRGGRCGFPSNHASNTWGLVFFMAYLLRNVWLTCFLSLWGLVVCYSRMYLGVHYLGDLLMGILLAFIITSTVFYILKTKNKIQFQAKHYLYIPISVGSSIFLGIIIVSIFYRI